MKNIKISIITACYNSEKYIEETIKSVVSQTYDNIEYIIMDNMSSDTTLSIVSKYKNYINIISSEKDTGIYNAFNKAIKLAKGDVVLFLSSDDFLVNNNSIESIMMYFNRNDNLQLVYGNILELNEKTQHQCEVGRKVNIEDLKSGTMPPHPATFVKKKLFYKFGFFNESYRIASDFEFILKCFKNLCLGTNILYINKPITVFRIGGTSNNIKNNQILEKEVNEILNNSFGSNINKFRTNKLEINELFTSWLENLLLSNRGITRSLKELGCTKIGIFGTQKIAFMLQSDCIKEGLDVKIFIDNNIDAQETFIKNVPVASIENIAKFDIDAIIVSISGNHDVEIINNLKSRFKEKYIIISWKNLFTNDKND